ARRDRRSRTALADGDDRPSAAQSVRRRLPRGAIGQVAAARDEAVVALVRLADVEQVDLVRGEPTLELVDRHGLGPLAAAALRPAGEVEGADRPEPSRRAQ